MSPDLQAATLARHQHGVISRPQALDLGMSRHAIASRLDRGLWQRCRPGIYVVGGAPDTRDQRLLAACLAGGADVSASHRSGLRVHAFVEADGRMEVSVQGRRRVRLTGVTVHQSLLLPDQDLTVVRGIPVTTAARTVLDASAGQSAKVVGAWIDDGLRRGLFALEDLRCCAARLAGPGRRDLRAARAALADRTEGWDPGDSDLEVRALRALARAGMPAPVQQHVVRRADGRIARIDLAYPDLWIAIELDGWAWHAHRGAFDEDRIRRNELTLLGWLVVQLTAAMSDDGMVRVVAAARDLALARPVAADLRRSSRLDRPG